MLTQHDALSRRCPMLGHEIPFSYCRQPGHDVPCRKVLDCWYESIDIRSFVTRNYSEEICTSLGQPPKPKALSILELVEQARKNQGTK